MKRTRIVGGIAIGVLLAASLVAAFLLPSAADVARGQCVECGFQTENLGLLG